MSRLTLPPPWPTPLPPPAPDQACAAAGLGSATPGTRKTLQLAELLGGSQGIDIDHKGHVYRLQITKAGKLILTK